MGSHKCLVVHPDEAENTLLGRALRLLNNGRKVLIVHSGAMQGARLELALREALDGPSPALVLVHRSGSLGEFRQSLDALSAADGELTVLLFQSGNSDDSVETTLVELLSADPTDWTLSCLYDADQALEAVGLILDHDAVTVVGRHSFADPESAAELGPTIATSSESGRALVLDLLLVRTSSPAQLERIGRETCLRGMDPALLKAVQSLHLARLAPAAQHQADVIERVDSRRAVAALEAGLASGARQHLALRQCDGELAPLLRAGAELAGHQLLLEDADFHAFRWSDEPRPAAPGLATLLSSTRLRRLAKPFVPGVPEVVRLGIPSAGTRLVMRLGHRRLLGYLSVLDVPASCPPHLHQLLQQMESPLVTALRYEQGLLKLTHKSRAQVLHDLFTAKLSAAEEVQAAAFIGWAAHERRGVGLILPRERPEADEDAAATLALSALRVSAEAAGFLVSAVGAGVAVLSLDDDSSLRTITEWLAAAGPFVLGYSEPIQAAGEVPQAMRQARWAAHLARTTGRSVLGFDQLGFDRLLFPCGDVDDSDLAKPLRQLRGATAALGFDPADTLEALLDAGGNIREASRSLHVHANTLRYRLSRIEATCGLPLDDARCRFDLQLAFRQEASRRVLRGEA